MKIKKYGIRLLSVLLLLVLAIGITFASAAEADSIAARGLALEDMTILYPANATEVEKTAATELQNYLSQITGKKPVKAKEYAGCPKGIYIGATDFAEKNNVTYTDNNGMGEGWAIKVIGNNVVVTGGSQRGVLYGVYHLLEDVLGVRWWNMWEEYVPFMTDALIPADYADSGEPVFAYRDIYIGAEKAETLFFARNRLNGWVSNAPQSYGGELNYTAPYHVHTFIRYFHPDGYFASHPEWYSWSEEKQARIPDGQLCLTNEELIAAFKSKFLNYIEASYKQADQSKVARPVFADLSPNDTQGFCECENCMEVRNVSGLSGYLLKFVNEIAAEVEKVYPEIIVATSAYSEYQEIPLDGTVPNSNVIVRLANSDVDVIRRLNHPVNIDSERHIEEWSAIMEPGQLYYWDYAVLYDHIYGVVPNYFKFQSDYQLLHEAGCRGILTEAEMMNSADMWDMNVWLLAKILEDPYQDVYALAEDFVTGYYGLAAAEDVFAYLTFVEESAYKVDDLMVKFHESAAEDSWLTAEEIVQANTYF